MPDEPEMVPLKAVTDSPVGTIFGNVGTTEFRFAVSDPQLKRMDYVKVSHPVDGWVVAQVTEIVREAKADGERLTGSAKVIGFRDDRGLLQAPRTPFNAEARVHRADDAAVQDVFGLRARDGAYVGFVKGYDLPVHLDINTLVQKHMSVLAKTGSGKSYVVGVLMEELTKKGVPIVVIDPHGEHSSLARPNTKREDYRAMVRFGIKPQGRGEAVVEYSPDANVNPRCAPLTLEDRNPEARDVVELLGGDVPSAQLGILHHATKTLKDTKKTWSLQDVMEAVHDSQSNAKWTLISQLEHLVGLGIFKENGTPVESLVRKDKVAVINLKGVAPDLQDVVVARLVRRLFEARKTNKAAPFMLVVEEAHNFCPERGIAKSLAGDVLRTIAAEGRKFGMGLTIITQRPAKVDKNVLSQCNTQIILKVTNPNDLKAIQSSVEGLTADAHDEIQRLPVGVAIVSHPRISMPVLVEIRPRETAHGGESVDVMEDWRREADDEDAPDEPAEPPAAAPKPAPAEAAEAPPPPPPKPRAPRAAPARAEPAMVTRIRAGLAFAEPEAARALDRETAARLVAELDTWAAQLALQAPEERDADLVARLDEVRAAAREAAERKEGWLARLRR